MTPALYIRKHIFQMTQADMAEVLGCVQPTVHRYEINGFFPVEAQKKVRALAAERGLEWNDSWFFEVPEGESNPKGAAA